MMPSSSRRSRSNRKSAIESAQSLGSPVLRQVVRVHLRKKNLVRQECLADNANLKPGVRWLPHLSLRERTRSPHLHRETLKAVLRFHRSGFLPLPRLADKRQSGHSEQAALQSVLPFRALQRSSPVAG